MLEDLDLKKAQFELIRQFGNISKIMQVRWKELGPPDKWPAPFVRKLSENNGIKSKGNCLYVLYVAGKPIAEYLGTTYESIEKNLYQIALNNIDFKKSFQHI